jgi:hypothetical protein
MRAMTGFSARNICRAALDGATKPYFIDAFALSAQCVRSCIARASSKRAASSLRDHACDEQCLPRRKYTFR